MKKSIWCWLGLHRWDAALLACSECGKPDKVLTKAVQGQLADRMKSEPLTDELVDAYLAVPCEPLSKELEERILQSLQKKMESVCGVCNGSGVAKYRMMPQGYTDLGGCYRCGGKGHVLTVIERDICKGGCGMDFAEFPEMRHTEEECGGMECTCYEIIGGH